jgi:cephalosporin-C deacetylase-like acetyl esterase
MLVLQTLYYVGCSFYEAKAGSFFPLSKRILDVGQENFIRGRKLIQLLARKTNVQHLIGYYKYKNSNNKKHELLETLHTLDIQHIHHESQTAVLHNPLHCVQWTQSPVKN